MSGIGSIPIPSTSDPANYNYSYQVIAESASSYRLYDKNNRLRTTASDLTEILDYIQTSNIAAVPLSVELGEGDFYVNSEPNVTRSNFALIGQGMGITKIHGSDILPDPSRILAMHPANPSAGYLLTANAAKGATSVTISSSDASNLAVGQYVLIKTVRTIDTTNVTRYAGELHQILAIAGGVVTIDATLYEAYNITTDATRIAPLANFYENVTIKDLTITCDKAAVAATLNTGQVDFRFIRNLLIQNCAFEHLFFSACQTWNCWDVKILGCHIKDALPPTGDTTGYGVSTRGATVGIVMSGCTVDHCRHGFTQGAGGGTNLEGKTRNINVVGNHFRYTTTSHIDVHQGAADVLFANNVMLSDDSAANAVQIRSPYCNIVGNQIEGILGRGISMFDAASDVNATGNTIFGATQGFVADPGCHRFNIVGNTFRNCTTDAIALRYTAASLTHGGDDTNIVGNYIYGGTADGIDIDSGIRVSIRNNYISNNALPIRLETTQGAAILDDIRIIGNQIQNNTINTITIPAGTDVTVKNNSGIQTENAGTATVLNATTSIVVTHGLVYTPASFDLAVTPTNNLGAASHYWVSAINATTFTINTDIDPGATTATFAWTAKNFNNRG